ncbi:MAG: hypothetical protein ACT6FF_10330, partial [Methanosarcinaceae archaeon]
LANNNANPRAFSYLIGANGASCGFVTARIYARSGAMFAGTAQQIRISKLVRGNVYHHTTGGSVTNWSITRASIGF